MVSVLNRSNLDRSSPGTVADMGRKVPDIFPCGEKKQTMAFKWGYDEDDGPEQWAKFCKPARRPQTGQSPIDIERKACEKARWRRLRLRYKRDRCTRISNNGHTFVIDVAAPADVADTRDYSLRRGPLKDDRFALCQMHFHWGRNNDEGSEHTVDGRQFAAEAHLVHFNMKYGSFAEASDKHDGLCVLGVLFDVGEPNKGIQNILDTFEQIKFKGKSHDLGVQFYPKWILPKVLHRQKFWYYYGSLTTPPCHESVNWVVFQKPLSISEEQLEAFRSLCSYCPQCSAPKAGDEFEGRLAHNFRPVQARNFHRLRDEDDGEDDVDRTVWSFVRRRRLRRYVKEEGDSDSSASSESESDESEGEDENEVDSE